MTRGRIRAKLRRSQLYTFACLRPHVNEIEGSVLGCPRVIYCNQPHMHRKIPLTYCSNYISTTKYNFFSFMPKALFEQFNRVANIYFLIASLLSVTPISPFTPVSMLLPLGIVVGVSLLKEALEDWQRFMQDKEVNARKVSVHVGDGIFNYKPWDRVQVGDIVKVKKDQFFPADLLLLQSSYEDGICYVETMNLDGETNLKVKRSMEATLHLNEDENFKEFTGTIKCENPNPSLYTFVGNIEYNHEVYAIDPSQILLRDSKLRNTAY